MNLFGGSKSQAPAAPAALPPPPSNDAAAEKAALAEQARVARVKAQGRSSTILTSGAGDTSNATTKKKTLGTPI